MNVDALRSARIDLPLAAILLIGALLRLNGVSFGLPFVYNVDEPIFVGPVIHMLRTGDLNPHWFGNPGSFVMYPLALIYALGLGAAWLAAGWSGEDGGSFAAFKEAFFADPLRWQPPLHLSGRLLMVGMATASLYLIYRIGLRLFGRRAALLGSLGLALAPLHVTHSRFLRMDITATALMLLSILYLLRYVDGGQRRALTAASAAAGFSVATKFPSGLVALPLLIHCARVDLGRWPLAEALSGSAGQGPAADRGAPGLFKSDAAWCAVVMFLAFFAAAPFVLLDLGEALPSILAEARATHLGAERLPGLANFAWYLREALGQGAGGLGVEVVAAAGLAVALGSRRYPALLALTLPAAYFLFIAGAGQLRWARWMIPVLPFEALLFGVGLDAAWGWASRRAAGPRQRWAARLLGGLAIVALLAPAAREDVETGLRLGREDTRTAAWRWVRDNIPQGSRIAYEEYAPHLHQGLAERYTLFFTGWQGILTIPAPDFQAGRIDYAILTHDFLGRYQAQPDRYAAELARYAELQRGAERVQTFQGGGRSPGPTIEVYKLR